MNKLKSTLLIRDILGEEFVQKFLGCDIPTQELDIKNNNSKKGTHPVITEELYEKVYFMTLEY